MEAQGRSREVTGEIGRDRARSGEIGRDRARSHLQLGRVAKVEAACVVARRHGDVEGELLGRLAVVLRGVLDGLRRRDEPEALRIRVGRGDGQRGVLEGAAQLGGPADGSRQIRNFGAA